LEHKNADWDATFLRWSGGRTGRPIAEPPSAQPNHRRPNLPSRTGATTPGPRKPLPVIEPPALATAPVARREPRAISDQRPSTAAAPGMALRLETAGRREFKRGLYIVIVVVGLAGLWASFVPLSGALVATGTVVAASDVKRIQHPVGGVVREILVHDGSKVVAGQVLVRLDPTVARGNLEMAAKRLLETRALVQRLTAERDNTTNRPLTLSPIAGLEDSDEATVAMAQTSLLNAHTDARKQAVAQEQAHVEELNHTIESLRAQMASKQEAITSVSTELVSIEALYRDKLTTISRLMQLRRDKSQLEGEIGSLAASVAETQSKIEEARLETTRQLDQLRTQVLTDLREAEAKEGDLVEQHKIALQQMQQIELTAPQDGIVHDLSVHTLGGVVGPAEVLMLIAPDDRDFEIEARLQPKDIDQVAVAQPAMLRFTAFDRNTTPELHGTVTYVSPDTTHDAHTNAPVYTVRIAVAAGEAARLGDLRLVAGMPTEAFLVTRSRTALTYLFKPFLDQLYRMFRGR